MANVIYNAFIEGVMDGSINLTTSVFRCLLVRNTSTYAADADDEFVSDLTGLVEISVASYARKTLTTKTVTRDDANDRVVWDFDDLQFGTLESGQTVAAYIIYVQTGGSDATPSDDTLVCFVDEVDTGLPAVLGGGAFSILLNSSGFLWGKKADS